MYTIRELLFFISCLFIVLVLMLLARPLYAANDLEKWNSEVGRTVRQAQSDKLAQTTYKEISSKNVKVAQDMRTVYPQIETSAQVAGSKTRVVAEAVLAVDKDKVWKDWAKKIGKVGKGANAVGGALVIGGLILDAVDWVIDEGGKVKRKPTEDETPLSNYQFLYAISGSLHKSAQAACTDYTNRYPQPNPNNVKSRFVDSDLNCNVWNEYRKEYAKFKIYKRNNPEYNSSNPPIQNVDVSEAEKEQVLKDLLNNPKYADLASQMIGNTYSMGPENPDPDPAVVNDIKNAQKDVLKSDNPKADGKTRSDPKIDTGTEIKSDSTTNTESTTNVNETTTTNSDGSTTTTGTNITNNTTITNTNINIPPACEYLAFLCEWVGWTKEEPELADDKLEIQERDVTDYKYEEHLKFGSSCPFSEKTEVLNMGVGVMKVKYNLDFFCDFSRQAKPTIIGIGHLGALIFLLIGIRSGASG